MKTIYQDTFTDSIAIGCSEENCTIDYFNTVEEALRAYPDAIISPSLEEESVLKVTITDIVTIKVNNQVLRLSLLQAQKLKSMLL
jgi:hypothetical protein